MLDDEVIPDGPFIGDLEDLPGQLYQEYEANPLFSEKIKVLIILIFFYYHYFYFLFFHLFYGKKNSMKCWLEIREINSIVDILKLL